MWYVTKRGAGRSILSRYQVNSVGRGTANHAKQIEYPSQQTMGYRGTVYFRWPYLDEKNLEICNTFSVSFPAWLERENETQTAGKFEKKERGHGAGNTIDQSPIHSRILAYSQPECRGMDFIQSKTSNLIISR